MRIKNILLITTIGLLTLSSCSKSKEKCWFLNAQYKMQSESMYFWGTEEDAEIALTTMKTLFSKEFESGAKIVATKGVVEEYNNQQACKMENDEMFGHDEKCWEVNIYSKLGGATLDFTTFIWASAENIDPAIEELKKTFTDWGGTLEVTKKISEQDSKESCDKAAEDARNDRFN